MRTTLIILAVLAVMIGLFLAIRAGASCNEAWNGQTVVCR